MGEFNSELVACTIATKNHLSKVRVLTDSFLRYHPNSRLFFLLVDEVEDAFEPNKEAFHLVRLGDLGIPNLDQFLFKYTAIEVCTAVKAAFLEYLLKKFGCRKIVYFDDDILVMDNLERLSELLNDHAIVLTPHLLEPIGVDHVTPNELGILRSGTYNLGFIAIADTQATRVFLEWWKSRLYNYCRTDQTMGLFVDQKWVELALGFFDGIHILRDPGYNVAWWNMGTRRLSVVGQKYFINGRPLRFFHFSGFDPECLERISTHQDRYTLSELSEYRPLFNIYHQLLNSAEYERIRSWRWTYGYFDNGSRIPRNARTTYYNSEQLQRKYLNPFSTSSKDSYFHWWNSWDTRLTHEMPILIANSVALAREKGIRGVLHKIAVKITNAET